MHYIACISDTLIYPRKIPNLNLKGKAAARDTMAPIYLHTIEQYPAVPTIDFHGTETLCWKAAAVST